MFALSEAGYDDHDVGVIAKHIAHILSRSRMGLLQLRYYESFNMKRCYILFRDHPTIRNYLTNDS